MSKESRLLKTNRATSDDAYSQESVSGGTKLGDIKASCVGKKKRWGMKKVRLLRLRGWTEREIGSSELRDRLCSRTDSAVKSDSPIDPLRDLSGAGKGEKRMPYYGGRKTARGRTDADAKGGNLETVAMMLERPMDSAPAFWEGRRLHKRPPY